MASGCGIISTVDIGQRGISIKSKSAPNIVNAIQTYSKNKKKLKHDTSRNKELIKKFTWKAYIDKLESIYQLITNKE